MQRIVDVYQQSSRLDFTLRIAQGPLRYDIKSIHTPSFVWFRVNHDKDAVYEAWVYEDGSKAPEGVPALPTSPSAPSEARVWHIVDSNYLTGKTSSFEVKNEEFFDGWLSDNADNIQVCLTHAINSPIVGPRSNLVRLIDDLLGVREDLLPHREYVNLSDAIPFLLSNGYVDAEFPTSKILHVWKRKAGPPDYSGNEGTWVVTCCMEGSEWIVLRRMTMHDNDVTVKDSWTIDSETGLIVQWNRDFGWDAPAGRIRSRTFDYQRPQ